jgi:hypothetical protein
VDDVFWEAFKKATKSSPDEQVMAALLKDYIDEDNVPSLLNAPCLKCSDDQPIVIPDNILKYSVDSRIEAGAGGNPDVTVYTLHLLDDSTLEFPIEVEVVCRLKTRSTEICRPPTPWRSKRSLWSTKTEMNDQRPVSRLKVSGSAWRAPWMIQCFRFGYNRSTPRMPASKS